MDVTLIPGSGVGRQVAEVVQDAVAALGADVAWDVQLEPEGAVASLRRTGLGLKGRWMWKARPGHLPPSVVFRRTLGVETILRHVTNVPGLPARAQGVDIAIVRQASEDIYAGFEHESTDGVYESVKVTTRGGCERVHRFAFEWARANGRKRVTTVHKANILKKADGMFLAVGREVAREYPELAHDDVIVDALCMQLVRKPQAFDVLVCGNLFGDIVSDCAAGMAGGITVAGGVNYGANTVVFENPHGATVEEVGPDGANPYPLLRLSARLLHHVGDGAAGSRLERAVEKALAAGLRTRDMGGTARCSEVRDAVIGEIGSTGRPSA